ncbi:uncharacterized protein LOC129098077 [Anoplopoma fimbria]|uniref:uncharacterized protein LOC129098077 n=1 Tax=Anoplopoma fimbria TaxID=229290 RepID=UPI0023EB7997|nr:uncharacterized protein LOC129098077 [Anoplopoma fimbria]
MTVKVQGLHAIEELRVNVRGQWTPLVELAEQCGYTFDRQDAEIIIAAAFFTCGIKVKDGKYTLSLQIGEKTFTLACPVSPPEELPHQPVVNGPHPLTRGPAEHTPEALEPFPWAPPFYLAPPYYPHPTYHHKYHRPDRHTADIPPTPSSSTPDPMFVPQPLPAVDSLSDYQNYYSHLIPVSVHSSLSSTDDTKDSGRVYPDLQGPPVLGVSERHSAAHSLSSDTGLAIQVESPPPLQPPSHAFNPYYHYYHHPKIPLPGPPQDSDPGPEAPGELSLTNPNNPEYPVLPPNKQQSEALRRVKTHQFLQPETEAAPHPSTLPTSPPRASAPYPPDSPQPYQYHYSYFFPHIARGEAGRLAPINPDTAGKNYLSDQSSKSSAFVNLLPRSSQVNDKYNLNTNIESQNADKIIIFQNNMPEGIKHPLLSEEDDDIKVDLDDKKRLSAPAAPGVQPPLPPTYLPRPNAVVAAPPPEQPSFPTPPPNHNHPPYPYYYHPYYHYYQMYYGPESLLNADNHVSPTSSKEALEHLARASSSLSQFPSYPNHQTTTPPTKSTYAVYNGPLHPYYYHYSHHNTKQQPYDAFGRPGGEESGERLDNGMKDCTVGQHVIFAVPDSVMEPTVAPPSELSNVSCTLQKLTSDIYTVPLDGCGVSKHVRNTSMHNPIKVFGQTVVHLLEVYGIHSLQQDHSSELEKSPVRLMVECSSSPGSSGEVRLHVMDQPTPPPVHSTPATLIVLLRIATDESFTSFHPEAHLPLSLMRGRPVYVEVSLLDPPVPGLVLLVHSCLAYTQAPYASWMLVYDSCDSQLLPSLHSGPHHIRRFAISGFLPLHSESPSCTAEGGYSHLEDPEIYFFCLTEVCSAADGDCTVGYINSPNSDAWAMK